MNIRNHRGARRHDEYRDLLKVARKTAHYTRMALRQAHRWKDLRSQVRAGKLVYYLDLTTRIIDQTERRVLNGESVPAEEKVLSVFEEHTDIIKKKRRETVFGHKLYLTGGVSGLILAFEVVGGGPQRCRSVPALAPASVRPLRPLASTGQLRWVIRLQGQPAVDEGPGHPGRRLRQETWAEGSQYGAFQLDLPTTATLSGRDRRFHLDAQASLRSSTLHLERLGPFSAVCGPLDRPLQLAGPGPPTALSAD